MADYPPFAPQQPTTPTTFDPLTEMAFQQWAQQNKIPFDAQSQAPQDYDMRAYWQGQQRGQPMAVPTEVNPNDNRPHFTDYYKTPLHQTFSSGSQWAGANAPQWINDSQQAAPSGRVVFDEKLGGPPTPPNVLAKMLSSTIGWKP